MSFLDGRRLAAGRRRAVRVGVIPVIAVAAVLAGCSPGGSSAAKANRPAGGTTTINTSAPATSSATSTTVAGSVPSSTTSSSTSTTAAGPAGGPVPSGFDPLSFTAVSPQQFWLLGTAACSNPFCTSIVRTTDGGAHFVGIPAPEAPLSLNGGTGVSTLRFADPLDGYAFGAGISGGPLWVTHDGGAHWATGLPDVVAFAASGGTAYAVTGTCSNGRCTDLRLQHSPAAADRWSATSVPLAASSGPVTLTASGDSVWISLSPASGNALLQQVLVTSTDGGAHLSTGDSPCEPGLGGTLKASSVRVVWAVCPTGMEAEAFRSSDGGAHWTPLQATDSSGNAPGQGLANSALIAPASDQVAVLSTGDTGELLRTTDGGRSWRVVRPPSSGSGAWTFLGFTTPEVGSALFSVPQVNPSPAGPPSEQLWRSTDGGSTWTGPVVIH